jgi:hypothetical protein
MEAGPEGEEKTEMILKWKPSLFNFITFCLAI